MSFRSRININSSTLYRWCALHFAAWSGHLDFCKWLLQKGISIESKTASCETALHLVCRKGFFNIARFLVHEGANINASSNRGSALLVACNCENVSEKEELVNFLVGRPDCDCSTMDEAGNTGQHCR